MSSVHVTKPGNLEEEKSKNDFEDNAKRDILLKAASDAFLSGKSMTDTARVLKSEHNLPHPTAMRFAKQAITAIHEAYKEDLNHAAQTNWMRLETLFEQARAANDRRMMLDIVKEENRILGVYNEAPMIEQNFEIIIQ